MSVTNARPLLALLFFLATYVPGASAYDIDTHQALGLRAAGSSLRLDGTLKDELGFPSGVDTRFLNETVTERISDGARFEDIPFRRVRSHFHNPLQPWGSAGLNFLGTRFQSSVLWGQRAEQDSPQSELALGGGTWSWPFARLEYLQALTEAEPAKREEAFAKTFRALGQLTHLIQDATVPAHVRNDPHPHVPLFGSNIGDPDPYETWVQTRRGQEPVKSFINAPPTSPAQSVFGPTGDDTAPAPVAGLIDTKTFLGVNPGLLSGTAIGNAEYTNGNFLSKDRLFRPDFPFPRTSSLDLASPVVEPEGDKFRRYFRKKGDGQTVEHFVAEGLLYKSIVAALGVPLPRAFTLTDRVQQDYAEILLPRAVGYSAALIDYFFRGKLDVDLMEDPADPAIVRVTGTNASRDSTDTLVDGTLTLYADVPDPNNPDQLVRRPAAALDSTEIKGVAQGASLTSARFALPQDAERFIAVYQGTLGNEAKSSDGSFPGGVIGKVLGGVRVEEIFNDGVQWKLRTPKGVFGLTTTSGPLTVARYQVVKWGDTDSVLIARTRLSDPQPAVAVFSVPRRSGSAELATPPGATDVVLTPGKRVLFPATTLLTTVNFTNTVVYRQHFVRVEAATAEVWVPAPQPNPDPNSIGSYQSSGTTFSGFTPELAYEQTIPFSQTFPVTLDLAHNSNIGTVFDPYRWRLQDLTVDASGRLLGLVRVSLGEPQVAPATVPAFRLNGQTGAPEQFTTRTIRAFFPLEQIAPLLWALVDLEQGTVVASTAAPEVTINYQVVNEAANFSSRVWLLSTKTSVGGPRAGTQDNGWSLVGRTFKTLGTVTEVTLPPDYEQSLTVDGWLRDDLRQAMIARGLHSFQPVNEPRGLEPYAFCDAKGVCSSLVINQPLGIVPDPGQLLQARRTQSTEGNQQVVFLALRFVEDGFGNTGDLLVWHPDLSRARFIGATRAVGDHFLGSATGSAALVSSLFFLTGGSGTTLFRLDPTQTSTFFPDVDLTQTYTLLEPSYLYNVTDLKFARLEPPLQTTALPAKLADLPDRSNPLGDYHAIRLPSPGTAASGP